MKLPLVAEPTIPQGYLSGSFALTAELCCHQRTRVQGGINDYMFGWKLGAGESFETIVESVENYIEEMNTFFVLETLETLRKNGRLSNIKAMIVNVLNIKPIMGSTNEGTIQVLGQARGMNKALDSMVQKIIATTKNCEEKILAISHCNCPKRAEKVKEQIENMAKFKKIIILETALNCKRSKTIHKKAANLQI